MIMSDICMLSTEDSIHIHIIDNGIRITMLSSRGSRIHIKALLTHNWCTRPCYEGLLKIAIKLN